MNEVLTADSVSLLTCSLKSHSLIHDRSVLIRSCIPIQILQIFPVFNPPDEFLSICEFCCKIRLSRYSMYCICTSATSNPLVMIMNNLHFTSACVYARTKSICVAFHLRINLVIKSIQFAQEPKMQLGKMISRWFTPSVCLELSM